MSLALYYQMIGRGIRIHPAKTSCLVIDLTDNYRTFGGIEDLVYHANGKTPYIASRGRQLTNVYYEDKQALASSVITMPFGKYKGDPVEEVDRGYLLWVADNCRLQSPLKEAVHRALAKPSITTNEESCIW